MVQQFADFMDGISWPLFFVTLAVVAAPLALVHELGHAVIAVLRLPGQVIVRVGGDNPTATLDLGRIAVRFHPIVRPWRADAVCLISDTASRADTVLIALGGPAASIAAGLLAFAGAQSVVTSGTAHDILTYVAIEGLFSGFLCLVPMTLTDSRGVRMRTDGALAIRAIRSRPTYIPRQWIQPTTPTIPPGSNLKTKTAPTMPGEMTQRPPE
jgi:hypothetical protein